MFKLNNDWQALLKDEFEKDYYIKLTNFLSEQYKNEIIYPDKSKVFNALNIVKFEDVKVVIIGQDPYHGEGQAHGLSFSVENDVKTPPSLRNIYKELNSDVSCYIPKSGNLTKWVKQGVLLLNSVLTVKKANPNSHKNKGWEELTLSIVKLLNNRKDPIIFLLWGNHAKAYKQYIDESRHYVLSASHPSPFSAYNGFFGCKHFSKSNNYLKALGKKPIDWQIEN